MHGIEPHPLLSQIVFAAYRLNYSKQIDQMCSIEIHLAAHGPVFLFIRSGPICLHCDFIRLRI